MSEERTAKSTSVALMDRLKWAIFPGINLHARERFRLVPTRFRPVDRNKQLLDAGFGNGMLAWQAYRKGYRVVGVSLKAREVTGATRLFNDHLGVPEQRLRFVEHNLYDTEGLRERFGQFDEIVCADVIEHINDDSGICKAFFDLLSPGGLLHLTTPNATHPYNASFPLDLNESGGHVRAGYTRESFENLLLPLGFEVEEFFGFGGAVRQWFNRKIKETQERFGPWAGVPWFLLSAPFLIRRRIPPALPFSWYVRVRKPVRNSV